MVMTSLPVHLLLQRKLLGLGVQSFLFYCRYYLFALFVFFCGVLVILLIWD